jgi:hypothetical protein
MTEEGGVGKESSLETAKKAVTDAIRYLALDPREEYKRAILVTVEAAFSQGNDADPAASNNKKTKISWYFWGGIISMVVLSFIGTIYVTDPRIIEIGSVKDGVPKVFGFKTLLMLLGFIVALSSYLASVIREIVKTSPKTIERYIKNKKRITLISFAEMQVVVVGLLGIIRIFTGHHSWSVPLLQKTFSFDGFIVTYLALILTYLSYLHYRSWRENKPWRLPVEADKGREKSTGG